jgi:hypothetical protein
MNDLTVITAVVPVRAAIEEAVPVMDAGEITGRQEKKR